MPGSLILLLDGQPASRLDLPVADIASANGKVAYGNAVKLTVKNNGTTILMGVTIELSGDGASNACLGLDSQPTSSKPLRASQSLKPGQSQDFWARSCYRRSESEDGKDLQFFVTATSMG